MSTYGSLEKVKGSSTTRRWCDEHGDWKKEEFGYSEPYFNHYKYRHQIDDHNHMRQAGLCIEDCFGTKTWAKRVFTFVLGVTEVNMGLANHHFSLEKESKKPSQMETRRKLSSELLHNSTDTPKCYVRRTKREREV